MPGEVTVRETRPNDMDGLDTLYTTAFPDEDLLPLVKDLLLLKDGVLSLAAIVDGQIAGHGMVTTCQVEGIGRPTGLLGPLAVLPAFQKRGIGGHLVTTSLQRMESAGVGSVCVLGDPAFYGRFGFLPDTGLAPPFPLPPEWRDAWQSFTFAGAHTTSGILNVPKPWHCRELWSP